MARGDDQINLRVPPGMREKIRAEAKANGRSLNAEIVFRLSRYDEICQRFNAETDAWLNARNS
ncbi:MAG: Arc family DNA-binding protein [Mesorhizobium sp.]|nr:MAG: Arc family DNA-binding protein [Mesorhizobium sp.]